MAMNGKKAQAQIPDVMREDGVWVRTPDEKGTAFLEHFCGIIIRAIKQRDQH